MSELPNPPSEREWTDEEREEFYARRPESQPQQDGPIPSANDPALKIIADECALTPEYLIQPDVWGFDDYLPAAYRIAKAIAQAREALTAYRRHHETYGSCRIELTGDRRCKDCRRADRALATQPGKATGQDGPSAPEPSPK